jgi:hypothetical protein
VAKRQLAVLGLLNSSSYTIFELDGEGGPIELSSEAEFSNWLRDRGLSQPQITQAIEDVKTASRIIRLTTNC